jgi:hypothetical protein
VAYTFRYPEGDRYGRSLPKHKDGHGFLDYQGFCFHPGIDFNPEGTVGNQDEGRPVLAVANGRVAASDYYLPKWGNIILIKHLLPDGSVVFSFYAHLKNRFVFADEKVEEGDVIGTVGRGPNNMYEAHLHFEMRKGNLAGEPADFFPAKCESAAWIKDHYYEPRAFIDSRNIRLPLTFCYNFISFSSLIFPQEFRCWLLVQASGDNSDNWKFTVGESPAGYLAQALSRQLIAESNVGKFLREAGITFTDQAGVWNLWNKIEPNERKRVYILSSAFIGLFGGENVIYQLGDHYVWLINHDFSATHEVSDELDYGDEGFFGEPDKKIARLNRFYPIDWRALQSAAAHAAYSLHPHVLGAKIMMHRKIYSGD